jgi:hypothetical protein
MGLAELMAIACFISPNPSPWNWMVSGSPAEVAALESVIRAAPGVKLVARADDGPIAFARYEIGGGMKYGEFMSVMSRAQGLYLMSSFSQATPSCADGGQDDVGNPHVKPVAVGVFGSASALADIQAGLGWTKTSPIKLVDTRTGFGFEPHPDHSAEYAVFVAKASKGEWQDAQVVLIRPANDRGR